MSTLADRVVAIHRAFENAELAHAFGGALALAWCTEAARGTIDIDINVFVDAELAEAVFDALPRETTRTAADLQQCERDGQCRVWWEATPIDLFLDTTPFHKAAGERVRVERFNGANVPFLDCSDLAVFKAFFNRTKDWADLEAMNEAETLDVDSVLGVLVRYLGGDDERVARLRFLVEK